MTRVFLFALAAVALDPLGRTASAQQMTMQRSDGEVIAVSAGQFVILKATATGIVIDNVISEGSGSPRIDLRNGDQVATMQGQKVDGLAGLVTTYRQIAADTEISLGVRRNGAEIMVKFPKPKPQQAMAVGGANGAPAGAWATAAPGGGAGGLVIAGVNIVENSQGMPEVSHRTSHPAGATVALRAGDVITAIDGRSIAALAGLRLLYERVSVNAQVKLSVKRGDQQIEVTFAKPTDQ